MNDWNIHACWRDPDCQQLGRVHRLYVNTPVGSLIIGYRRDSWAQVWLPFRRYVDRFSPVVWHPRHRPPST